jgi:hypothetical protein
MISALKVILYYNSEETFDIVNKLYEITKDHMKIFHECKNETGEKKVLVSALF